MRRKLIGSTLGMLAAATLLVGTSATASATPIQWWDGQGANGHYYELVGNNDFYSNGPGTRAADGPQGTGNYNFTDGQNFAAGDTTLPGFQASLATITSQRELDFLTVNSGLANHGVIGAAILTDTSARRPIIGASANATANNFQWVPVTVGLGNTTVQEPFTFTNWAAGEPTPNSNAIVRLFETGLWVSDANTFISNAILLEWSPIPEPGSMVLCGMGALAMFGYGWRRRRNRAKAAA